MKIIKSILCFILLTLIIFFLRIFSDFFLFEIISPIFDLLPDTSSTIRARVGAAGVYCIVYILLLFLLYLLKIFEKNEFWYKKWNIIKKNFVQVGIAFLIVGFYSDIFGRIIFFLQPLLYYYLFKKYCSDLFLINKFFLKYDSVKKYFITFIVLEIPFLIQLIVSLLWKNYDSTDITIYYLFSNVRYYLPFFIFSWWDNRKLICNNQK